MAWITRSTSRQPWGYYSQEAVNNAREVYAYFGSSMTLEAVSGLIANMDYESWLNPLQGEVGGTGIGLIQWTPPRNLKNYVTDWTDPNQQMDLIIKEGLNQAPVQGEGRWSPTTRYPYTWNEFCNLTDYNEATKAYFYERERGTWSDVRTEIASFIYQTLSGETPPEPPPEPPPQPSLNSLILLLFAKRAKRHKR